MPFKSKIMKMHFQHILLFLAGIVLIASCTKKVNAIANPDSEMGFFNASEYVQAQILNTNRAVDLLIDAPDTTYPESYVPNTSNPNFSNGTGFYQYPAPNPNTIGSTSWVNYMRIVPGTHTVTLTDTSGAHHVLITNRVETSDLPVTLYYSDSLGHFRGYICRDNVTESANAIQLRVFDLSPDAGKVFFTIGGQPATGFPDTLRYGAITPFTAWTNPVADTLQIRFYSTSDSVDILASAPLTASPGHAYNVVFTGYMNQQFFPDPVSGQFLYFNNDLKLILTQND